MSVQGPYTLSMLILSGWAVDLTRWALPWLLFYALHPQCGVGERRRLPGSAAMKLHVPMCGHIMDFPSRFQACLSLFF